jgi:hypothetical protein
MPRRPKIPANRSAVLVCTSVVPLSLRGRFAHGPPGRFFGSDNGSNASTASVGSTRHTKIEFVGSPIES